AREPGRTRPTTRPTRGWSSACSTITATPPRPIATVCCSPRPSTPPAIGSTAAPSTPGRDTPTRSGSAAPWKGEVEYEAVSEDRDPTLACIGCFKLWREEPDAHDRGQ